MHDLTESEKMVLDAANAGKAARAPLTEAEFITAVYAGIPVEPSDDTAIAVCVLVLNHFNCCDEHLFPIVGSISRALKTARLANILSAMGDMPKGRPH